MQPKGIYFPNFSSIGRVVNELFKLMAKEEEEEKKKEKEKMKLFDNYVYFHKPRTTEPISIKFSENV